MRFSRTIAAGIFACAVAFSSAVPMSAVRAQDSIQTQVDDAVKSADLKSIALLIQNNKGNTAILAQIATILLASAQATQAGGNTDGGAQLAALAVLSGGLTGNSAATANSIATSSSAGATLVSGGATALASVANGSVTASTTANANGGNGFTASNTPSPSQSSTPGGTG